MTTTAAGAEVTGAGAAPAASATASAASATASAAAAPAAAAAPTATTATATPAASGPVPGEAEPVAAQGIEERLDRLTGQVDRIAALLAAQEEARERRQELVDELTGVAQGVMAVASRELEDLSADVTAEDVFRFLRTATRTVPKLEVMLTWAASLEELAGELTALSGAGMASLSDTLARAQARGYFDAARAGGRIADRMALALLADADGAPPSTLALLRRLRDPQVRRGLDRTLTLLQAFGAPSAPAATTGVRSAVTAAHPATHRTPDPASPAKD